jgi:hypothetical protein
MCDFLVVYWFITITSRDEFKCFSVLIISSRLNDKKIGKAVHFGFEFQSV